MSTGNARIRVIVDDSDALEKLANVWLAVARLTHPLLSEDELEEMARAELAELDEQESSES